MIGTHGDDESAALSARRTDRHPARSGDVPAAGCQRSLDAVSARVRGDVYLTYDPKSVTVTSLGDGAWDLYGEVRLSTYGYSRTHTYECRGMTQNQNGTWNIPDRSLS